MHAIHVCTPTSLLPPNSAFGATAGRLLMHRGLQPAAARFDFANVLARAELASCMVTVDLFKLQSSANAVDAGSDWMMTA